MIQNWSQQAIIQWNWTKVMGTHLVDLIKDAELKESEMHRKTSLLWFNYIQNPNWEIEKLILYILITDWQQTTWLLTIWRHNFFQKQLFKMFSLLSTQGRRSSTNEISADGKPQWRYYNCICASNKCNNHCPSANHGQPSGNLKEYPSGFLIYHFILVHFQI